MHLIVICDNDDKSHYRTIRILLVFDQVIAFRAITWRMRHAVPKYGF